MIPQNGDKRSRFFWWGGGGLQILSGMYQLKIISIPLSNGNAQSLPTHPQSTIFPSRGCTNEHLLVLPSGTYTQTHLDYIVQPSSGCCAFMALCMCVKAL